MATEVRNLADVDLSASRRSLILVWQNPSTQRFVRVGRIDALPGARFAFHYVSGAFEGTGFDALDEFPSRTSVYVSDEVPAFFANRVLSSERRGYGDYLEWLGLADLDKQDVPFEVLARTGGGRATDTFHVIEAPDASGARFTSRFFVSGIRHSPDAPDILEHLKKGDELLLARDESNPYNAQAVLINASDGRKIGYVPDWLCGDVYERLSVAWRFTAIAERVNANAPAHLRLLCRLHGEPSS